MTILALRTAETHGEQFIPCTLARDIGGGVLFRPLRSWHSLTYAGEGLERVHGDASGCARRDGRSFVPVCLPYTVTHRLYWNRGAPKKRISAFLSYPGAMGVCPEYFWEIMAGDVERFTGERAEEEMESRIRELIGGAY